jgi:hypothetical protein
MTSEPKTWAEWLQSLGINVHYIPMPLDCVLRLSHRQGSVNTLALDTDGKPRYDRARQTFVEVHEPFTWTADNPPPPLDDTESIIIEVATDRFREGLKVPTT